LPIAMLFIPIDVLFHRVAMDVTRLCS